MYSIKLKDIKLREKLFRCSWTNELVLVYGHAYKRLEYILLPKTFDASVISLGIHVLHLRHTTRTIPKYLIIYILYKVV